jgi:hypothetical protein
MGGLIDITGKRFGRWKVLAVHPERRRYGKDSHAITVLWRCRCDCGVESIVFGCNLRRGLSKSCGCAAHEATRKRNTKHGHAVRGQPTRAYVAWQHLKQRCLNPNNKDYANYGGRGIGIYPDYCNDFLAFFADVLDPPDGLSLDRINVNGNYEPGNCRWADAATQRVNQRPRPKTKKRLRVGEHRGAADDFVPLPF